MALVLSKDSSTFGFIKALTEQDNSNFDFFNWYNTMNAIPVFFSFAVIFLSFAFIFKGRGRLWFLIGLNVVISVFFLFDLWYFRGYGNFLTIHLLKQTTNLDNLSDSIVSMGRWIDFIFFADIALLMPFVLIKRKVYKNVERSILLFILLLMLPIINIYYIHYKVDIVEKGQNQILFRICWTPSQTIAGLSPIGYHIFDSYTYWQESRKVVLTQEQRNEIKAWFDNKKEALPDNKYKAMFKGKNLIFLQVESLENFVINQKINDQEITPNLNKLIKNGLYFPDFYEQVYNGTSSDGDLMANTSVYPIRRGSTFFRYPYNEYNSMPKLMKKQGYTTLAAHPDKGAYWNWMEALKSMGFDKLMDATNFTNDETIGLGLSDGSFLRQMGDVISKQKQPFYTFMVTLTSHGPFNISQEYRELKLDASLDETKLGGYFQSIRYTDKQIGALVSRLEKDGLLDNTVLVVYGDHCGIHKFYADELETIKPSQDWWMENNKEIPFIIYQKNLQGETINTKGGQIDILPTVAYLMGVDEKEYEDSALGRNLLKTRKDFAVLANRTFVGTGESEKEKEEAIKGIDIADMIISGNYFSDMK